MGKNFDNAVAGTVSGIVQAGVFNPWDRALYISVVEKRKFLLRENFRNMYQGFSQAVFQRTISGGLYFFLQGACVNSLAPMLRSHGAGETQVASCIGLVAGSVNGMALNQMATIKYHMWNSRQTNATFQTATKEMWRKGGYQPFVKGVGITGSRDAIFGIVYEVTRHFLQEHLGHLPLFSPVVCNMLGGAFGTILSGPFNYARNLTYHTPPTRQPPRMTKSIKRLFSKALKQPNLWKGLEYLQIRLKIGWGSGRVAVGMSVGQYVFEKIHQLQNRDGRNNSSSTAKAIV